MPTESGGQSTRKRKAKTKNLCSFWKIALGSVALIYGAFVWSTVSSNRRLLEEFQRGLGDDETRSLMAALNNNTNDENSQQSEKKGGSQARPLPIVRIPENMNLQPKIKFKLYRGTVTDKQRDRKTSQNRTTSNSNKQQEQVEYFVHVSIKIPLEASQTWMSSLHSFFSSSLLSVVRTDASRSKGAVGYVESWYETALTRMEKTVTSNQKKNLVSCRRPSPSAASDESNPVSTSDSYMTHPLASCQSATIGDDLGGNGPFYYYNPLSNHARIVCGKSIPPKSTLVLNQLCEEPVTGRLFPTIPTPTGKDMPPIVTRFNKAHRVEPKPFPECDIACHQAGRFVFHSTRTIDGVDWKITMSMEGPMYYENLLVDPEAWKKGRFYSTTSFQSEIPIPYYSVAKSSIWNDETVDFDKVIHGGVFMARNCGSRNNRERVIRELQNLANDRVKIESVSSCLHNAEPPPGSTKSNKLSVMNKYLFYFAFENQCYPDYITEKLWGPMEAGTLPIYFGAPNVRELVPTNSIIHLDDFANSKTLFRYLEKVASNKTLYYSYHAWRKTPQPEFASKLNFT